MDVAASAAQAGASEGLVVIADEQTAGRGRRGRVWSSPASAGIYLSVILRPPLEARSGEPLSVLTLAMGLAVRCAIENACGLEAELKWPNDVAVHQRKLAGILAEGVALGTTTQAVVVGIGVNVLSAVHGADTAVRATSLEAELGRRVERGRVLEEILVAAPAVYEQLRRGDVNDILRAWRHAAPSAHGASVEWDALDGRRRGITAGIDGTGALLVRTGSAVERVLGGEIRWL